MCCRIEEEEWDKYIIPSKTESEKYKVSRTFSFIKSRMYSTRNKNKVNIESNTECTTFKNKGLTIMFLMVLCFGFVFKSCNYFIDKVYLFFVIPKF